MQNRRRGSGNTDPSVSLFDPGINKSLSLRVRLSFLRVLGTERSRGNPDIADHVDGQRLRRDLLLIGGFCCANLSQELCFGLHTPIIVNDDNAVIEDGTNRLSVAKFVCLISGFLQGHDFRPGGSNRVLLCRERRERYPSQRDQTNHESHCVNPVLQSLCN
jgi:hypothetical protein